MYPLRALCTFNPCTTYLCLLDKFILACSWLLSPGSLPPQLNKLFVLVLWHLVYVLLIFHYSSEKCSLNRHAATGVNAAARFYTALY